ncbi:MAG TPA: hypothetical protein VGF30_06830 [Bacteroidia bacterium]
MRTFLYTIGFVLLQLACFANNGDTTKVKYDINDPRNPDCPCHKYQQLADEEYQMQIANDDVQIALNEIGEKIGEQANKNIADNEYQKQRANEDIQIASKDIGENLGKQVNKEPDVSLITESVATTKVHKTSSGSEVKKVKANRSVFRKHTLVQHKSYKPKKKRFRFGRKDNSRCTKW